MKEAKGQKGIDKMKVIIRNYKSLSISTSLIGCGHFVERDLVLNSDGAEDLWKKQTSSLICLCYSMHRKLSIIFYINKVIDLEKLAENLMYQCYTTSVQPLNCTYFIHTFFGCKWCWYFTVKVKLPDILVYAFSGLKSWTMVTALLVRKILKT